jgi:hypothetical protein
MKRQLKIIGTISLWVVAIFCFSIMFGYLGSGTYNIELWNSGLRTTLVVFNVLSFIAVSIFTFFDEIDD